MWHHQIQTKSASSKSAFKINTTIYVNHFIGIYAIKVNSCPEKERDEEKREVKHGCLARANLKNNSSSGFPAVSYIFIHFNIMPIKRQGKQAVELHHTVKAM